MNKGLFFFLVLGLSLLASSCRPSDKAYSATYDIRAAQTGQGFSIGELLAEDMAHPSSEADVLRLLEKVISYDARAELRIERDGPYARVTIDSPSAQSQQNGLSVNVAASEIWVDLGRRWAYDKSRDRLFYVAEPSHEDTAGLVVLLDEALPAEITPFPLWGLPAQGTRSASIGTNDGPSMALELKTWGPGPRLSELANFFGTLDALPLDTLSALMTREVGISPAKISP